MSIRARKDLKKEAQCFVDGLPAEPVKVLDDQDRSGRHPTTDDSVQGRFQPRMDVPVLWLPVGADVLQAE